MSELISAPTPLQKLALNLQLAALGRALGRRALSAGGGAVLGGAGGAAAGGVAGGLQGYQQARREGRSGFLGALGGGASGAAVGAGAGGALGAGVGALGGRGVQRTILGLAKPGVEKPGVLGGLSRFGQRQAHSLTGAVPEGFATRSAALESIGGGVAPLRQRILAETAKRTGGLSEAGAARRLQTMREGLAAGERATEMGMTSVPGFFRAMATQPGRALGAASEYQWKSNPRLLDKAMALGMPATFVGGELARAGGPGEEGRAVRGVRSAAEMLPYSLGPMPMSGAMVTGAALGGGVRALTRALRRKQDLGSQPGPPVLEDGSVSGEVEHVYSDRALGRMPEGQL